MLKLLPVFYPQNRVSQAAAGGMTRSNPVVSRKTFLAVARGFLLEEREEAYFRIDWAKTMTDPHFLRQADRVITPPGSGSHCRNVRTLCSGKLGTN